MATAGAGPLGKGWTFLTPALPCLVLEPGELFARIAGVTEGRSGLVRLGEYYPHRPPPLRSLPLWESPTKRQHFL